MTLGKYKEFSDFKLERKECEKCGATWINGTHVWRGTGGSSNSSELDLAGLVCNKLGDEQCINPLKGKDGGQTWDFQFSVPSSRFRSVGFVDSLRGWVGNLGAGISSSITDTNIFYETLDGGNSWGVVQNLTGPRPEGICGINIVNDTLIYAVGRLYGPSRFIRSNDGGDNWTTYYNQPTAQFYRVTTDNSFPYKIYGAQQDNSTIRIKHRTSSSSITERDWESTAGGESAHLAPDPNNSDIVYGGTYKGYMMRRDHSNDQNRSVNVWPDNPAGSGAEVMKYRF